MQWKKTNKIYQKAQVISEMVPKEIPFSHICKKYSISEKAGYKWGKRFF